MGYFSGKQRDIKNENLGVLNNNFGIQEYAT